MVLSTASVHISSVELMFVGDIEMATRQKLWVFLKTAPVFIPFTIFKAGALAIAFAVLRYGGLVHVAIWLALAVIGIGITGGSAGIAELLWKACSSMATNTSAL